MAWGHLGYQWDCVKSTVEGLCSEASDRDILDGMGDGFENPGRRGRVFGAARRHARRTGHEVVVERHSRTTLAPRKIKERA